MDPAMEPINGISLERYADLGAAVGDFMDDAVKVKEVLDAEGVSEADFEAAKAGWTARMMDMSLMGRIAMAYQPLYAQARARRKGGTATVSYDDFVHMSAVMKVFGHEAAAHHCGISMADWAEAGSAWTQEMGAKMGQYAGHHDRVMQEDQRLRAGEQPRKLTVTRQAGTAPAAPDAQAQAIAHTPGASGMDVAMAQMMNTPYMQQANAQAAAVAANPLGMGLGQAAAYVTGGIVAGGKVMVQWNDGNSYPGTVMQVGQGQYQVQFPNGSQQWIPAASVRKA